MGGQKFHILLPGGTFSDIALAIYVYFAMAPCSMAGLTFHNEGEVCRYGAIAVIGHSAGDGMMSHGKDASRNSHLASISIGSTSNHLTVCVGRIDLIPHHRYCFSACLDASILYFWHC